MGRPFFCVFKMYFLTLSGKYCIIKAMKESSLQNGIFFSHFFICIFTRCVDYLFCHTEKREESHTFSRQPFLLCVGRTYLRALDACISLTCVFIRYWNREMASRKTAPSKNTYYTFGLREPFIFVLF